jgi:aminopeptidase YwaD
MIKAATTVILTILIASGSVLGGDLYKVVVQSRSAAEDLAETGTEPVVRTADGYLVLADADASRRLAESGLDFTLLATDISKDELALDMRFDDVNRARYPVVYEEGQLRVFQADVTALARAGIQHDLAPLAAEYIRIYYEEPRPVNWGAIAQGVSLDSLISLVDQDSLISYTERLQAFFRRVSGTDSNYAAVDWLAAKFQSFGYDSVITDEFTADIYGELKTIENVVAYKVGTVHPNRYIIVGGHLDGVPDSPAADDNGSGTAGTLEIARVLKDIETEATFVFIAFNAEEQGLYGAYDYANRAAASGDSIIYMLNMDMIAHYENTDSVKLFYGADDTYSRLWQSLADSLLGLNGVLSGSSGGSDHYPFAQNGYDVTFVHEYIFSTVYHYYRDSTTYMNFDYMTKLVKASLAAVYAVMLDAVAPGLEFAYPAGLPDFVLPGEQTLVEVNINSVNGGQVIPGTAELNCSIDGGPFESSPMVNISQNNYEVYLPEVDCGSILEFYFSAEELESGPFYDPEPSRPYQSKVASQVISFLEDDFQTYKGWTTEVLGATSGQWHRAVPVNDPTWDYDPISDGDGSGTCYLTQNTTGNSDVDDGAVRVTSPVFELTPGPLEISYYYYLYLTDTYGGVDKLLVEINNSGGVGSWVEIARHDTNGGLTWRHYEIDEADLAAAGVTPTSAMKIRFTANDDDPQSIVEAAVDGIKVRSIICEPPYICGDANRDESNNMLDILYLISYLYKGGAEPDPLEAADVNK